MKYNHILIKRIIASIVFYCITVCIPAALFAVQKPVTESAQGTFSGDYVIYRDYSWKAPTWIGFLYYDDETYGAFIHTPEKNSTVSLLFSGKTENDTLTLTGQQIISAVTADDTLTVNYLMSLLPKLYSLRTLPQSGKAPFGSTDKPAQMEEFGGTVVLHFQSFIPLFHLNTMTGSKKETILELAEIGSIKGSGESAFYGYTPIEIKQGTNTFKIDKAAKKETVTVSGISLHLDSQWKKIADNSFLCGNTAFLTVSTVNLPPADSTTCISVTDRLIRFLAGSSTFAKVMLPYTVIEGTAKAFTLHQSVYDIETKKITKDIKRCIKNKDGSFTIISLTIDSYAYNAERAYFDRLFSIL